MPLPAIKNSTATALDTSSPVAIDLESQLDDQTTTSDPKCFGIYWVYAQKPVYAPLLYDNLNMGSHSPILNDTPETLSVIQSFPHLDEPTEPYFHPFSNPLAAVMMIAHHSGALTQSLGQTTRIAHILESLGSDLETV